MERLQQACSCASPDQLEKLLADEVLAKVALSSQMRPCNAVYVSTPNLQWLLSDAARSGQSSIVQTLLGFAGNNSVPYNTLITRDSIFAALDGGNDAVIEDYIKAWPATANLELGHMGYPLLQALSRERFDLATYLLEHGADPNARCGGYSGSGAYLRIAAQRLPLSFTTLLLHHGARVAQSGAIRMAAEKGRLDVLQQLVDHDGDVNERLQPNVGFLTLKRKYQHASETPLHTATEHGHCDVVKYLLEHGADAEIGDLQGRTPRMLALDKGDEILVKAFDTRLVQDTSHPAPTLAEYNSGDDPTVR